jgi:hypothetical protein
MLHGAAGNRHLRLHVAKSATIDGPHGSAAGADTPERLGYPQSPIDGSCISAMQVKMNWHDGRWRTWADEVQPERCPGCGYRGAPLHYDDDQQLRCSQCAPQLFPSAPQSK